VNKPAKPTGRVEAIGPPPPAIIRWLATGFGTGYSRWMPGTVGAVVGLPLTVLLAALPGYPILAAVVLVVLVAGSVHVANRAEAWIGGKDPRQIVIDEYVTLPIVCLWTPISALYLVIGFMLHRALDILKPPPARQLEKLGSGLGIVIDDVCSSLYAGILMMVLHYGLNVADRLGPTWLTAPWLR
jgi:phosphatidylglycerophosphatase A